MNGIAATFGVSNKTDIYFLNTKFGISHNSRTGTNWGLTWDDLGGTFVSVPAAVAAISQSPTPNLLDVFGTGIDFAIYRKTFDGANWTSQWENLGGTFISAPGVIELQNGRIDVFAVGLDYAMYHKILQGIKESTSWERLGGTFSSTASVVSFDPNRIDVFARGADFTLRHRYQVGGIWLSDWQNLGGSLASPPVALSWGPNRLDVFAVGTDAGLWHRWWDGEYWSGWEGLGGSLTATPTAVTLGPNQLEVFALGTDGSIYQYLWNADSWRGKQSFDNPSSTKGSFTSGPTAISAGPNWIDLMVPGTDGRVYYKLWNGSFWQNGWIIAGNGRMKLPTRYQFSVDYVHVTNTRSLDTDTDTAQASVKAGNWAIQTYNQVIGDIGGSQEAQLSALNFDPVTVELCEAVLFDYLIVNNGHADQKTINDALVKGVTGLSDDSVKSISKDLGAGVGAIVGVELAGNIVAPVIGSLLGALVGFLMGKLGDIVFADCDGIVAAEQIALTGRDLYLKTANGPLKVTTIHNGSDSPTGCGANSQYEVTWSIKQV